MDIQLPVKTGIEATQEIRELERLNNIGMFPPTPSSEGATPGGTMLPRSTPASPIQQQSVIIVALTAGSHQSDRVEALAAGCNDFLTKPVSLPWLQQKLLEWGSMAYLSGFGPRKTPPSNFDQSADAKASLVASQLHIERPHAQASGSSSSVEQQQPLRPGGPSIKIRSSTPERSNSFNSATTGSSIELDKDSPRSSSSASAAAVADAAAAVATVAQAVEHQKVHRPGPSPLVGTAASSEGSIDQVLAEGNRLLRAGSQRSGSESMTAESFASVMMGSAMRDDGPDREPRPVLVPQGAASQQQQQQPEELGQQDESPTPKLEG
jgi:CheY-like chemotaxis protein